MAGVGVGDGERNEESDGFSAEAGNITIVKVNNTIATATTNFFIFFHSRYANTRSISYRTNVKIKYFVSFVHFVVKGNTALARFLHEIIFRAIIKNDAIEASLKGDS
jgi:hypothetical protein